MIKPQTFMKRIIQLSITKKDYNGNVVKYGVAGTDVKDLEEVFKKNNYSTIHWMDDYADSKNFKKAVGFVVDIEDSITIDVAVARLQQHNLNYALITSKSHTPEAHRFHVLIPYNRPVYTLQDYGRALNKVISDIFPEADKNTLDGARRIYGSPDDAAFQAAWDKQDFNIDGSDISISDSWNDELTVTTRQGDKIKAGTITTKTQTLCPWHDDTNHSAFIEYSDKSDNWYIRCSACNKTFWKVPKTLAERCTPYWSLGTGFLEIGIVGGKFCIQEISIAKIYSRVGASTKEEKKEVFDFLANEKHIPHLNDVNLMGDASVEKTYFKVTPSNGTIDVYYAALPAVVQDNAYIEDYLDRIFRKNKQFIKEWLAVYCYTNYKKLPTLVFKGKRGTGKSKFGEMVLEIFKPISLMWHGKQKNFNSEVKMKLLVSDETVTDDEEQYKMLKQYSGQKYATINEKYQPEYTVKNNVNMILLSNEHIPIFVKHEEMPTDKNNNQWFVMDWKKIKGKLNNDIETELRNRLGHYVRTEIKSVYEKLNMDGKRYFVSTPITDSARALFENNLRDDDVEANKVIEMLIQDCINNTDIKSIIEEGYMPTEVFSRSSYTRIKREDVIRNMVSRRLIDRQKAEKFSSKINGKRPSVYPITKAMQNMILDRIKEDTK